MSKYLDNDGLLYLWNSKIKPLVAKYLPLTGGTLTGKLKLSGAPTALFPNRNPMAAWYYYLKDGDLQLNSLGACDVTDNDNVLTHKTVKLIVH